MGYSRGMMYCMLCAHLASLVSVLLWKSWCCEFCWWLLYVNWLS